LHLTKNPDGETLRGVATDGHRMAIIDTEIHAPGHINAIVPTEAIDIMAFVIDKKSNEPVTITLRGAKMQMHRNGLVMMWKMIDGTFPDYTRVIPEDTDGMEIHFSKEAIQRMAAFATSMQGGFSTTRCAKIDANAGTMSISELNGDGVCLPCQAKVKDGVGNVIGYNFRYLADQAKVTPVFRAMTKSPTDPAILDSDDPNAFWILMPMRT
jgi:DNA polymerase-3 subunit beta